MTQESKVICIIPARGGSKGVPRKNLKPLRGRPLIEYVVSAAQKSKYITEIYVSTEDKEIKEKALSLNVQVIDRPDELADDNATSEVVMVHAIGEIKKTKDLDEAIVIMAQLTSPLTLPADFDRLVECLWDGHDSAAFYVEDYAHFFDVDDMTRVRLPRQQREPKKREAGNAWAYRVKDFLQQRTRLFGRMGLVRIDPPRDLEIDTEEDFFLLENIIKRQHAGG